MNPAIFKGNICDVIGDGGFGMPIGFVESPVQPACHKPGFLHVGIRQHEDIGTGFQPGHGIAGPQSLQEDALQPSAVCGGNRSLSQPDDD